MEEEHIVDDGEIINEEHLMSDTQFSGNGNESTDRDNVTENKYLLRQKRQNLTSIDDLAVDMKDTDAVAYIETTETDPDDPDDPLSLEQICVPVDGENVSWMWISSYRRVNP